MSFHFPNLYRLRSGHMASSEANGNNGAARVPTRPGEPPMTVIASDGMGWEHVSVSRPDRMPTWAEMCRIKDLFWDGDDVVIQYHPREAEYVNNHSRCLHMWRPVGITLPTPPALMVGDKALGVLA